MRNILAGFVGGVVALFIYISGPSIVQKMRGFSLLPPATASTSQTADTRPMPIPRKPISKVKKAKKFAITCSAWQQPMFGGKPYKVCTRRG